MPEVGGFVALTTGMEVREMPTPTCCDCEVLVVGLRFGGGQRGTYSCKDHGGGDVLVGWQTEPAVAGVGGYGDEPGEAAEEARGIGPEVHFH